MISTKRTWSTLFLALLFGLVVIAAVAQPISAQNATEPAFIVAVNEAGSAEVSVRSSFDLETESERQAFLGLLDDDQAQENAKARFLDRMNAVADDAENATGRDMQVTDPTIELSVTDDNETGVITLSATWSGLAAVEGDTLVITEPFASGFTTERQFILRAPHGYMISSASPEPVSTTSGSATWDPGTELAGFSVTLQPAPTPTEAGTATVAGETTESGGQPGFGLMSGIAALLTFVGVRAGRRKVSGGDGA